MPGVGISGSGGIVFGAELFSFFSGRHETYFLLIINVITAPENLGSLLGNLQQISQRLHRVVVQKWRAKLNTVERHIGVAVCLTENAKIATDSPRKAYFDFPIICKCKNRAARGRCRSLRWA